MYTRRFAFQCFCLMCLSGLKGDQLSCPASAVPHTRQQAALQLFSPADRILVLFGPALVAELVPTTTLAQLTASVSCCLTFAADAFVVESLRSMEFRHLFQIQVKLAAETTEPKTQVLLAELGRPEGWQVWRRWSSRWSGGSERCPLTAVVADLRWSETLLNLD